MNQPRSPRVRRGLALPGILALSATAVAQGNDPNLEARVQKLEQSLQQRESATQASDGALRLSRLAADDVTVPDLQGDKAPSVTSAVDLKFWGRVNFVATYDNFQGTGSIGGADYQNYITSQGNEELSFNPRDSRFGFAAASSFDDWTGRAVVETDFYGSNSGANLLPRIRLAYVEMQHRDGFSLRCGQDWVPIAVQNPGLLDFGILAWSGNLWNRVPQITGRCKSGEIEATLGLLHSRVGSAQDQQERMPWVVGRLAWTGLLDGSGLLAINGGYRGNTISPTSGSATSVQNHTTNYLAALEAKVPLTSEITVTAEAWTGAGVGAEFVRSGLDYDSTGESMQGSGGFVNAEWKIDGRWSVNAGFGIDDPADDDTTATTAFGATVPFDANRTAFANVRCQFDKQLGAGVEVLDMRTELANGATSGADGSVLRGLRLTFGMWFIF